MLTGALDATWRNFSTLFLLGAIFFVPLHLGHAYAFRNEISVQELGPEIEGFPENKRVRNVGNSDLARERATLLVLYGIDVLVAVGLFGAARRVHTRDGAGEVPTVGDALQGAGSEFQGRPDLGATIVGVAVGAIVAWLVYRIGALAAESLGAPSMFVGVGLARAVAASTLFAVAIGCAAASARSASSRSPKIDLY